MQRFLKNGRQMGEWALLLLLMLSAMPVHAETTCGIVGVVVAPGYAWRQRAEILQLQNSRLINYTYSDTVGEFSLPWVHGDYYDMVIHIDGYLDYRERITAFGCRTQVRTFFMEREPNPVLDFSGEINEVVDISALVRKVPSKILKEFERARQDRIQNNVRQARRRLEEIVKADPDFYEAHNVLGGVYAELKMFREAEAEYNQARKLRPKSAAPLVSLGSLYLQEAAGGIGLDPGTPVVLVQSDLGIILDDARSVLLEAVRLRPEASFAHYLLGVIAFKTDDDANAEKSFRRALEIEPRLRWAQIGLANLYVRRGEWRKAIAELDDYLENYPNALNRPEVEAIRQRVVQRF